MLTANITPIEDKKVGLKVLGFGAILLGAFATVEVFLAAKKRRRRA